MADYDYDLIVIGAGPAGQKAALQGAKIRKKVAIIERERVVGGSCATTGTLPSKTLREGIFYLSGLRKRSLHSQGSQTLDRTIERLLDRRDLVIEHEIDIIQDQLNRNNVEVIWGEGGFLDEHTVRVVNSSGSHRDVSAAFFVIATGSRPNRPDIVAPAGHRMFDSDTVLELSSLPRTISVLGGGVIGCEYACIFGHLGCKVDLVDHRTRLLGFIDMEITDALAYHMRNADITIRLAQKVEEVRMSEKGGVETCLANNQILRGDCVFVALGRRANIELLNLDALGIQTSPTGLVEVNESYQTAQHHIYAVGDVIGFPALASTSMEQGRLATCHAFGEITRSFPESFPYGVYTVPEIAYVGKNEEDLKKAQIPYEIGRGRYNETARGQILADESGMLKLLFHRETLELLGVHIIGDQATELVHIGQAVLAHGGKVTYFIDNVFNYPTLAECYKVAALNGINRL